MIRILTLALVALMLGNPAQAAENTPAADTKKISEVKPKPRTEAEEKKLTEKRKRIAAKKTELNGSSWELTVKSTDPKEKGAQDTFVFQDGIFKSKNLTGRGFTATNYTVTVPSEESESAVWETMQTGKEGQVFIHGEWEKEIMRGNSNEQLDGGKKIKDYYFTTSARSAIPPISVKSAEEGKAPKETEQKGTSSGSKTLVSKESKRGGVTAFKPGSTDEAASG